MLLVCVYAARVGATGAAIAAASVVLYRGDGLSRDIIIISLVYPRTCSLWHRLLSAVSSAAFHAHYACRASLCCGCSDWPEIGEKAGLFPYGGRIGLLDCGKVGKPFLSLLLFSSQSWLISAQAFLFRHLHHLARIWI